MLHKLKIGPKLTGGFLLVAAIAATIGVVGITQMKKIEDLDTMLYEKMTVPIVDMLYVTESFQRIRVNMHKILLANSRQERLGYRETINQLSKKIEGLIPKIEKTLLTKEARREFQEFNESRAIYRGHLDRIFALVEANKMKEAEDLINGDASKAAMNEQKQLEDIVANKAKLARDTSENNSAIAQTATMLMIGVIIAGVIIALSLGLFLTVSITRPLVAVVDAAKRIADGDLTVEKLDIRSQDEIGVLAETFGRMAASLNEVMVQVNASVEQVASGAGQVSSASQSLSQGASEQASSLEEITSSVTEINSQTKQNADNASQANAIAKQSMENAEHGNRQMRDLVTAMADINRSSDEIKKVVKVIDDIAFQINLLALNANVEAARAGKYGKGFAVVAEEVRNLAGRSAESVKETTQMVESSIKNIVTGNKLVEETAKQLNDILGGASKVADLVEEIAMASREQAQGLDQINVGLSQIDQVTQANTSNAEESASASEELASQAQQLKSMVARFKLSKGGNGGAKIDLTSEVIQKYVHDEIIKREAKGHSERLHEIHAGGGDGNGSGDGKHRPVKDVALNAGKALVKPADAIRLDDANFGHF